MKTLFTCLNLTCLTIAIFFSVKIIYRQIETSTFMIPDLSQNMDTKVQSLEPEDKKKLSDAQTRSIIERNLFKASISEDISKDKNEKSSADLDPENETNLAKTKLNLKLWGTVAGIGSLSFAVIQEQPGIPQALYHENDIVAGAIIKKILRSSVILNHNNENQLLEMETTIERTQGKAPMLEQETTPSNLTIERSTIEDAMNNMETLMKQVRMRPHFSNGQPDGLLIYGIKENTLFNKMGLKNGDIIMGVDNREINSIDEAMSLYQGLRQASNTSIKLKRRGKIKEINYNVQQ